MTNRTRQSARPYVGRFAPSPSGPLHAGSLVTAMASYLDARAHKGRWLLRIEDTDGGRLDAFADREIMRQLRSLGMCWDADPVWQSQRQSLYQAAFQALEAQHRVFGCACSRKQHVHSAYPGTCRNGIAPDQTIRAWRFKVDEGIVHFTDRWFGPQRQDVQNAVGDFIIKRADGYWAYQFTVVVDDGAQGITDVVRGADLLSSSARQIQLARALSQTVPRFLHVPLVLDEHGSKLSKQNHAAALDCNNPLQTLNKAWVYLGFEALSGIRDPGQFWQLAIPQWASRLNI